MLTPVFTCEQDGDYIIITITLSAICKPLDASFDIVANQFTFFCRPYYLRLTFNETLTEGKGEHASYDLETNQMRVWVPKETAGQTFTDLDNPAFLIATAKERARITALVSGGEAPAVDAEEEETEFVQVLSSQLTAADIKEAAGKVSYGFANHFSGLFQRVDEDIVTEMIELAAPETTSPAERRALRLSREQDAFDEAALYFSHEDSEGEVAALLRYVPDHVRVFQEALQSQDVPIYSAAPPNTKATNDAFEEEEVMLLRGAGGGVDAPAIPVWAGNVAEFTRPVLIEEVNTTCTADAVPPAATVDPPVPLVAAAVQNGSAKDRVKLAIPTIKPRFEYTSEENRILTCVRMPRLLFRPSPGSVAALTLDILFSEAYDDIFTEGQGCCESVWNICTLSPALSFLDPASTPYDACVFFARRALIYPLHRHFEVVQRVFAIVGTRLLLGRHYVLRALLRVFSMLSHSEHKHVLDTIFLEPLLAYWLHRPSADEELAALAIELHQHVARTQPVSVECKPEFDSEEAPEHVSSLLRMEKKVLQPITLFSLGLPFSAEDDS